MKEEPNGPELVRLALAGDKAARRRLVELLSPIVHARVARKLVRSHAQRKNRELRQEIEDFVQEAFVALFADGGRSLRAWDPARGMSLQNFVGLLTEHHVDSILRSGRRSPWTEDATKDESLEREAGVTESAHARVSSRDMLAKIIDRLRAELTPSGIEMFELLVVESLSVGEVCQRTGMTADAVYAWRSRLGKQARQIREELEH